MIASFLRHLRYSAPDAEIIVVDGGSADETFRLAQAQADHVLTASRGRASQMNAGARLATGDVFWFLHADCEINSACLPQMVGALQKAQTVGGCFRLRIPRPNWIYRISDSVGNVGVSVFGFALGDHGIFCRRGDFFAVGEYPIVPLMEDAELYRRLRKRGEMRQLAAKISSSPRRYEALGPYRTTFLYMLILALYVMRVPLQSLALLHRRFTSQRKRRPVAENAPLFRGAASSP